MTVWGTPPPAGVGAHLPAGNRRLAQQQDVATLAQGGVAVATGGTKVGWPPRGAPPCDPGMSLRLTQGRITPGPWAPPPSLPAAALCHSCAAAGDTPRRAPPAPPARAAV